mgnify:FL=1|jgi:hypothetical protein
MNIIDKQRGAIMTITTCVMLMAPTLLSAHVSATCREG